MTDIREYAIKNGVPIIKDGALSHLIELIRINHYHDILELGSAIGYSAINMALVDPMIHVDTIERESDLYEIALKNIKEAKLEDQITIYNMDIRDFKPLHDYDLIFVDAGKGHYKQYFEMFIDYLMPWGVMFFDNMSFHGMVKDQNLTHNRHTLALIKKLNAFRDYIQEDERFVIMLDDDTGDGILEVRRKNK